MKRQYLANLLLVLVLSLSPAGSANGKTTSDDINYSQVYMPFIGYSSPLVFVHKQGHCSRYTFTLRGDITNERNQAIYDVILEAKAFDDKGQWLETETGSTIMTATLSGQLNPFEIGFHAACHEVGSSEIEVKSWSWDSPQVYLPTTIVYTSTVENFGEGTWVTAEFRNDAGLPMKDVTGLAWSVYETFNIGPLRHIADTLAPGETVTYTEYLQGIYGNFISTIEVAAQGVIEP